ncbi:RagB/SusD family nutrient uptake outer membrane protein [Capnocytophaga catalasegens]|uniref:Membrane protein n=1 Tax=Capnocytophaga catalasegens TaxID=1004260 RepID=A0AAV5AW62_9FLAO|nr:RagB/SusD family nutrient uptake outer membrane protein [Capnocytophaga catalasegens]GIZ14402.1 membrane protein [Capnocytophaga catalasegens]GJM51522.1 membrane protein [Capnocytophaga catalasegens]GJM53426.1 membrane protein [Capnocytophaga catalasegens]
MKPKFILNCTLSVVALLLFSCDAALEEDPKGKLDPSSYFSNQDELNMSVYALYHKVMLSQNSTNMQVPQWMGDDITTDPKSNKQHMAEFDSFFPSDNNKGLVACWDQYYIVIKAANYIILNAAKTPTTKEEINIAIGQAKYWRAYSYFSLVRTFGAVPMNLENRIDYNLPPSPVEAVYEQIVRDLQDAEAILPTDYKVAPRKVFGANAYITQQAVKATLSAVYMAMAGWPLQQKSYYALAAEKAKEVIDGVNAKKYEYILEPEFKHVYAPSTNYTLETVVGINYQKAFRWEQDSQLTSSTLFASIKGWGDAWGEILFWKNMPEGKRKDVIYAPKIRLKNGKLVDWWEKDDKGVNLVPENHPMMTIFTVGVDEVDYDYTKEASIRRTDSHRHRCIRYAEVLLWYAESQARSEGTPNALAYECVNKVRERAGLPPLPAGMSGEEFANAAMQEHGWEVAGYWCALVTRRADQMRMNILKDTYEQRKRNEPIEVAPGVFVQEGVPIADRPWNDNFIYAPYPDSDASLNPNLIK